MRCKIFSIFSISAIALFSATTASAQVKEIRTLKDYVDICILEDESEIPEECERLKEAIEEKKAEEEEQKQKEKKGGIGGYAGVTLGASFPDIDEERPVFQGDNVDIGTGVSSSLFAGIKFNSYLATDLEFGGFAGEIDSDLDEEENYFVSGIFLNPKFTLPFNKSKKNSLALFISPGIGVTQLSASVEDEIDSDSEDDDDDFDRITLIEDDSRFTWQIKGGVAIPVSSKFSIIPQIRYASQTGDNAIDYFGTEVGVQFNF